MKERKRIRLKGYDYSQNGYYFVTMCAQDREHFFGHIKKGVMDMNSAGKSVDKWVQEATNKFSTKSLATPPSTLQISPQELPPGFF